MSLQTLNIYVVQEKGHFKRFIEYLLNICILKLLAILQFLADVKKRNSSHTEEKKQAHAPSNAPN